MKSFRRAHVVIVANSDRAILLAARLLRMEVANITSVSDLDEARQLCNTEDVDACIVAFGDCILDSTPMMEAEAPGRQCGVPTLMLVDAVTPHVQSIARRNGYLAPLAVDVTPRQLYRRIGAALQRRRAARRNPRLFPLAGILQANLSNPIFFASSTIH